MARPKRDSDIPSAKERLDASFWEMLAEMPFEKITIGSISARAGVNHNTFYYHYASLTDMAEEMIDATLILELPSRIISMLSSGPITFTDVLPFDDDLQLRFKRLCLLVGSHSSAWIQDAIKERVFHAWADALGMGPDDFSREERILLTFAIGGLFSVLSEYGPTDDGASLRVIADSGLGNNVLATFNSFLKHKDAPDTMGAP